MKQEMMGWQWHQPDHTQIIALCSKHITMPVPNHAVFTGWLPFLTPNQKHKSTEGRFHKAVGDILKNHLYHHIYLEFC